MFDAAQGPTFEADFRVVGAPGEERWLRAWATPVLQPDGNTLWNGVSVYITEMVRAQETLRENEERLREAQHIAHMGDWHWDILQNELHCCHELYAIFGLSPHAGPVPPEPGTVSLIDPEESRTIQTLCRTPELRTSSGS